MLRVTILGCGSSGGVPRIGPDWGACDPTNPKNRRRRCSCLVERLGPGGVTAVLVDTSPDLREQMLSAGVGALDGVVYTHDHADHTHGVDDLRAFSLRMRRRVPVYMDPTVWETMHTRFGYCFRTPPGSSYPPILDARPFTPDEAFHIDGAGGPIVIRPISVGHGDITALALRFDDILYMPDVNDISADATEQMRSLDTLIIDALRYTPHPSHFTVSDALDWIDRLAPKRAILTNLHVDLDYDVLTREAEGKAEIAYDGLVLEQV